MLLATQWVSILMEQLSPDWFEWLAMNYIDSRPPIQDSLKFQISSSSNRILFKLQQAFCNSHTFFQNREKHQKVMAEF
jgi:hypothetical protein